MKSSDSDGLLHKVKQAMLSMQRASWEQGVAAQAMLELGEKEMLILMAYESVLRQTDEGRLSVLYTDNGVTDPAASGDPLFRAAQITGDPSMQQALDQMVAYLLNEAPRSESGIIYHTLNAPEIWIDSMYMCPPLLTTVGLFEESVKQIKGIKACLWNQEDRLYSHRWNDEEQKFINPNYWGVGNGWALAALTRVIPKLPVSMEAEKRELQDHFRELLDSCLSHMRPDHLFHNDIDDRTSFVETNLSQMIAYSIYRAVSGNWLEDSYVRKANQMRKAAHGKVDEYGFVQGVCGAPFFNSPGRATEGQAFFLLMEAAHRDLLNLS